jgi:prepilin-type N-terminal cleavage/methylation domain-containing protein
MKQRRRLGFSITELLISVSILSLGAAVTLPTFTKMVRANRLNAEARAFMTTLRRTRGLAAISPNIQLTGSTIRARIAGVRIDSTTRYAIFLDPDTDPTNQNEVDYETFDLTDRDREQKIRITIPSPGTQIRFDRFGTTSSQTIKIEEVERGLKRVINLTAGGQARLD